MNPIVVKYGGSLLDDTVQQALLLDQIALAWKAKLPLILVHGGGKEISRQMEKAGLVARFVNGRRFTDEATMKVVEQALSELNNTIVEELGKRSVHARGLSGRTHHVMQAQAQAELGRVGLPRKIDAEALERILLMEGLPVFFSVAEDAAHHPLNVNADDFALELAVACHAKELIFLTDTGGILDASGRLIESLVPSTVDRLIEKGTIHGGMLVKAQSCVDALHRGVHEVHIGKMVRLIHGNFTVESGTGFALK